MDPSRGDSRYNLNYSMSSIGLSLADQADMYGNPNALGGRPPSTGILQGISGVGGGPPGGLLSRSAGNLMSNTQCQSLGSNNTSGHGGNQQRGLKRAGSDCYEDSHHRVSAGSITSLQGLDACGSTSNVQHSSQQQPQSSSASVQDIVDESYNIQSKKSPPANGKKTKGRVKIKMEYIDNKLRRYTTFSKRKTGIMKKAYELSTLTGTQVMLLVASETGHVYTFATRKLQPMITSEAGKQLIQTCLNSPDPPSVGGGDQRMSATGFEETELSYNIADEDSKVRQLIYGHHGHAHLGHPQTAASHYSLDQSIMQSPYSGGQPSPLSHSQAYTHAHHSHVSHVPHSSHSHMSHTHPQR
ncbi:putative serum response factor [Lucilia cuprina]|uniref:Serum response factor homolog n=1 Tax=Lucilia cuprina TaxID=7375 RepID=A0A0L0CF08_LUCCU|nr:serum response factor homolog isoform X2 [Lucilia cuprina]KAI8117885.1 Serum response factor like protein [Lucilia cuprina]KNC30983.1 putative serum response factor [Lucilia cuprina]